MRVKSLVSLAAACFALPGWAQEATVVIIGTQTDAEARRDFVAGTIVISRKRIEDSGARSVEELLKREPAVTVRDGRLGLLNMPGYTQVLIDGHAPLSGTPIGELNVINVEQIEIIKSGNAQFGPFGIAGTINIISRKTVRKTSTEMAIDTVSGNNRGARLSLSHNQSMTGSPLRYSIRLSADRKNTRNDSRARQTLRQANAGEQSQWSAIMFERSFTPTLVVTSNATWQLVNAGIFSLSPEIFRMGGDSVEAESRQWEDGAVLAVREQTSSALVSLTVPLKWTFKPTRTSQLEMNMFAHASRLPTEQARTDDLSTTGLSLRNSATLTKSRSGKFSLDYKVSLAGGHALKAGTSLLRVKSRVSYDYRMNGLPDSSLNALGMYRQTISEQERLYLQDEWRISESVAASFGVSAGRDSMIVNELDQVWATRFGIWSPSLHLSKKLDGDDKQQFRMSVSRSIRAPMEDEVAQRPEINPLAPCWRNGICPANTIGTADTAGSLQLRPEHALGLNVSYEHGIGDDSQFTVEIFTRHIDGKIGKQILLENVPWSAVQRYVSRPSNLGKACSTGINLEMELALEDLIKGAPKATVRASVGLATSHVATLPGPDNHLDKQTPWTAKLGGSYGMKTAPIKLDIDASWSPGEWTRTGLSERIYVPRSFEFDASIIWSLNHDSRLVLGLQTKYPRTHELINEYSTNDQLVRLHTTDKQAARLKLQFETKL